MPQIVRKLLVAALLLVPCYSWSLTSDKQQPINIEADHAQFDDKRGISQYKGDAVLTQGSLRIEGDIISFYFNANKELTKAIAQGKRASYQQLQQIGGVPIRAQALKMEYHTATQQIILLGDGHIWQQDGEMSGEYIEYDINNNIAHVSGRQDQTEQPKKGERVHIVLQPTASNNANNSNKPTATSSAKLITPQQPATHSTPKDNGYPTAITTAIVNIRTGPGTQYKKLTTLAAGSRVFVLSEQPIWVQVRAEVNKQGVIGWVSRTYLQND